MLLVFVFVLIILLGMKKNQNRDYLDHDRTFYVRGIMMVAICFSHILPFENGNYILRFLFPATVAPFFFYSGYGLAHKTESVTLKGKKNPYLHHFFKRRLGRMFCTIVIINCIIIISKIFLKCYENWSDIIQDSINIGWFTTSIIIFYIAFYFIYQRQIGKEYVGNRFLFISFLLAYIIICRKIGLTSIWYANCFSFALGLYWANKKELIDHWLYKYYGLYTTLCVVALYICNMIIIMREKGIISFPGPGMVAAFIIGIAYPLLWNLILIKFDFKFHFWHWIGVISFEMYLIEKLSHPTVSFLEQRLPLGASEIYAVCALLIGIGYSTIIYHLSCRMMNALKFKI